MDEPGLLTDFAGVGDGEGLELEEAGAVATVPDVVCTFDPLCFGLFVSPPFDVFGSVVKVCV